MGPENSSIASEGGQMCFLLCVFLLFHFLCFLLLCKHKKKRNHARISGTWKTGHGWGLLVADFHLDDCRGELEFEPFRCQTNATITSKLRPTPPKLQQAYPIPKSVQNPCFFSSGVCLSAQGQGNPRSRSREPFAGTASGWQQRRGTGAITLPPTL